MHVGLEAPSREPHMVSTLSENGVQNGSDFLKLELEIASVEGVCIIITCPEAAKLHMSHMTRVINVYFFFWGGGFISRV